MSDFLTIDDILKNSNGFIPGKIAPIFGYSMYRNKYNFSFLKSNNYILINYPNRIRKIIQVENKQKVCVIESV